MEEIKFPKIKVSNMTSPRGGEVPNQFVIETSEGEFFQSYRSIIAFIRYSDRKVFLDERYWDYSTTTGKYRNEFLGDDGIAETRKKIASGEYTLVNLN